MTLYDGGILLRAGGPMPVRDLLVDGGGPPLLLLAGFAGGAEAWGVAFVRALAERFTVYRPGWPAAADHVRTIIGDAGTADDDRVTSTDGSPADRSWSIADLVDATLALPAVGRLPRMSVLGWGLGALVATQLAVTRPELVERLALIGGAASGAPLLAAFPTVAALCDVAPEASAEEHMLGLLGRLVSPAWRPFAEMFLPQLLPRPAATLAALRQQWAALAGFDLSARLSAIRCPVLALAGDRDALIPPAAGAALPGALPRAHRVMITGTGHAVIWEQPGAVLDQLLPFLQSPPSEAASRRLRSVEAIHNASR